MTEKAPAETNEKAPAPTDDLLGSATRFAQSGLGALLEKDLPVFFMHSATALELLSKAQLATIDPSLIAGKDFDSLLHARGQGKHALKRRMKTISFAEALERSGYFVSALGSEQKRRPLHLLMEVRHGVVHLGQLETQDVDEVLAPYLRACDALLAETEGVERKSFWGDFLEFVDSRLSESAKEAEGRAQGALAAARLAFKQRYDGLEEAARTAALTSIEGTYDPSKYFDQVIECPACGRLAVASGSIKTDWKVDWDVEDGAAYAVGVYPVVTFSPDDLECRVCGLELTGEELVAVGIGDSWQLDQDEVDASDFEDPWQEPDWEDWGR